MTTVIASQIHRMQQPNLQDREEALTQTLYVAK
jgi:hypothetical protein